MVILESPYAGDVKRNVEYARMCMKDALLEGHSVFASHLLYTQCLDDSIPEEREVGIRAGLEFYAYASAAFVYVDRGISRGMIAGMTEARKRGVDIYIKSLATGKSKKITDILNIQTDDVLR